MEGLKRIQIGELKLPEDLKVGEWRWKYEQVSEIHLRLHGEELPRKKFISEENQVRDTLKHFDRTDEPEITCDIQDVSL